MNGWVYPASAAVLSLLSTLSFPIKIGALLDTRRRAASPLVNQQTTVLLLGIAMGLGAWLCLMLWPLQQLYQSPFDPQVGSALMLLYPAAIGYATVRYRLFDATVVIRRSVIYTGLAGLITGAYALLLAGTNALLAQTDLTRSPWFSAGFMFVVVLLFNPLRERVRRAVDRTFFRERHDYALAMRTLARSMSSLLDLDEITRRLTTTIESAMHVRATRLLVDGFPHDVLTALEIAPGALSRYQLAADPRFGGDGGAALGAYQALGAEVVVPLRFQARSARAAGAGRQAVGGALYRRGSRDAGGAGRPGRGGGGQRGGAPPGAGVRPAARAQPAHPRQPRQVRAAPGAAAHRGIPGGAVAREDGDRRQRALRRHQRLHAAVLAAAAGRPGAAWWSATSAPSSTRSSSTAAT